MLVSPETQNLISELNKFSNSKIKNLNDLELLVEASKTSGKEKLFDDIIFSAKYLNGLGRILQVGFNGGVRQGVNLNGSKKEPISDDALDKIRNEYKQNLKKISNSLKDLIQSLEESECTEFTAKYLSLTRESMVNLSRLIYDLTWLKTFKNKRK